MPVCVERKLTGVQEESIEVLALYCNFGRRKKLWVAYNVFFSPNIFRLTKFGTGALGDEEIGTVSVEEGLGGLYKFETRNISWGLKVGLTYVVAFVVVVNMCVT